MKQLQILTYRIVLQEVSEPLPNEKVLLSSNWGKVDSLPEVPNTKNNFSYNPSTFFSLLYWVWPIGTKLPFFA
jgi:hypothetical protein